MRLTKSVRSIIVREILSMKFAERDEALAKAKREAADLAYEVYMGGGKLRHVNALPAAFFETDSGIPVAVDGRRLHLYFMKPDGKGGWEYEQRKLGQDGTRREPSDCLSLNSRTVEGRSARLAEAVEHIFTESSEIKEEKQRIRIDTESVLSSVTTRAKLISVWPEIEPTLDRVWSETNPTPTTKAITVKMEDLNARIGLPEVKGSATKPKPEARKKKARKSCRAKTTSSPSK